MMTGAASSWRWRPQQKKADAFVPFFFFPFALERRLAEGLIAVQMPRNRQHCTSVNVIQLLERGKEHRTSTSPRTRAG